MILILAGLAGFILTPVIVLTAAVFWILVLNFMLVTVRALIQ